MTDIRFINMRLLLFITTVCLLSCCARVRAQDTLPKFQVFNNKGRIFVAFYNPYETAKQVNIERSHDSIRNFTTLYALTNPKPGTVTFSDIKTPNDHMYYRVFIQLQGASYTFTPSLTPAVVAESSQTIKQLDAIAVAGASAVVVAPKKKPEWVPSPHVYTDDYGNVRVDMPLASGKKYLLRFYDDQHNLLFDLPDIKEVPLTIDKSNFFHAGWFYFELYEDGVIQEKNKFLLSKDS
jgi:hypothetical protein